MLGPRMKRVGRCLVVSVTASVLAWTGCHDQLETAEQALIGSGSDGGVIGLDAIVGRDSDAGGGSDAAGTGSDGGLGSGSDAGILPDAVAIDAAVVVPDAVIIPDALVVPDAGTGSGSDAGTGSGSDAGTGSGSDAGIPGDGGGLGDAGVPEDGHAGAPPADAPIGGGNGGPIGGEGDLDRTSFYACAGGTAAGIGAGLPIVAAALIALRPRRRAA